MTKEEYLRKVAEMQTDISAIKQEGGEESKTCNACIHNAVCYRYSYGLPENYADKCGDYLPQKSGKWHIAHGMYEDRFWCSCGYIRIMDSEMNEWKYCPVCGGAKMVEPQESEDKE